MNNNSIWIFSAGFLTGAVIGVFGYKRYLDKQEEDELTERTEEIDEDKENVISNTSDSDKVLYSEILKKSGYEKSEANFDNRIYPISLLEFSNLYDHEYDKIDLIYFEGDGVITDDMCERIENPQDIIGSGFERYIHESDDDTAYIRNENRKCDYEIVLDLRSYSEVKKLMPKTEWEEQ